MPARWPLLLAAALVLPGAVRAEGEAELVELINARRAEPRDCAGKERRAGSPLAPSAALARVEARTSAELGKALGNVGYLASTAATIIISGPRGARDALRQIEQHYCASLLNAGFADIGVSRSGSTWRINIARPLIAKDLGDGRVAGQEVLRLVNEARGRPRTCGARAFGAVRPLAWNDTLAQAAIAHSRDMATHDYFDHADAAGATVAERAARSGYRWRVVGENIAAGQGSAEQVVAGWLASPGHCRNIMSRDFAHMGAAYAINGQSEMEIYWTQTFGSR
ncbi:MAG: CAP domain-containing protein [Caldimonas sp.]